jgi:hypothetical protein
MTKKCRLVDVNYLKGWGLLYLYTGENKKTIRSGEWFPV